MSFAVNERIFQHPPVETLVRMESHLWTVLLLAGNPILSDRDLNPKAAIQPLQCRSVKPGCVKRG